VGADAAVLLVEENGALAVQRASGLGATSQRALEAWFAGMPGSGNGVQLIDDVSEVPELAPVLEGSPPLTSLCCAPLPGAAGPNGMLVVLSRNSHTFLPQDLDWIEAFAAQAGVAVSNARLYADQQQMARRDQLTGLGNRRAFEEALDAEVLRFTRSQREFSLALLDLDNFKVVNDSDGHAGGDELLCDVARALEGLGRATDSVYRLGGDEFAVLLTDSDTDAARAGLTRSAAAAAACDMRVGVSVGIATCPGDGLIKDDLLRIADARLYEAKPPRRGGRAPDDDLS
jgi:diguanylate cyclase (GGDEF)-like protein